jgi:2-methylaconitate cis-trans-isomerase PrpF
LLSQILGYQSELRLVNNMNQQVKIKAVWMRGGTSKGLFFHDHELPTERAEREAILLAAIGSPDPYGRQLNGVGGATSSTSKVVIVAPAEDTDFDVNYTFGHVAIQHPVIDWTGNCGNLTAAVAHFAIEEKLIKNSVENGIQLVRIWQTNLNQAIHAHVPVKDGLPVYKGNDKLDGVSGTACAFRIDFLNPSMGATLPTGNVIDVLKLDEGARIEASLINAGNPTIFVRARDIGLTGTELPAQLNHPELLQKIEKIRQIGAWVMGLVEQPEQAALRPATPKVALISNAQPYSSLDGQQLQGEDMDVCARIFSMGIPHGAFTGTGAIAVGIAALIKGSILAQHCLASDDMVRLGHPSGLLLTGGRLDDTGKQAVAASLILTARRLMDGHVYVTL